MTQVNIFMDCSGDEVRNDQLEISDFIQRLNAFMVKRNLYFKLFIYDDENVSSRMARKEIEKKLISEDCQLVVFLLHKKVEQYVQEEFEAAYNHFKESGTPAVLTFFRTDGSDPTPEVKAFMDNLDKKQQHFSNTYSEIDDIKMYSFYSDIDIVKMYLLLQLRNMGLDISIEFNCEQVFMENISVLSANHLSELAKNPDWKKLQAGQFMPPNYMGNDPYIFISYSHKDKVVVFDIIKRLQNKGFRVFYDDGKAAVGDWDNFIAHRIINCYCVCVFLSKAYWASKACVNGLKFAVDHSKPYLNVYIQKSEVPTAFQMLNSESQDIYLNENSDLQKVLKELSETTLFQKCRQMPSKPSKTAKFAKTAETAMPVKSVRPVEPVRPVKSVKPAETESHVAMDDKPHSYTGYDPYIFVSYSHKDDNLVLDIIKQLQDQGFRVFYDEGISSGAEWDEYIADRIDNCCCICAFFSKAYWNSSICKNELRKAVKQDKPHLGVHLQQCEIPNAFDLILGASQDIYFYKYNDRKIFLEKLYSTVSFKKCLSKS